MPTLLSMLAGAALLLLPVFIPGGLRHSEFRSRREATAPPLADVHPRLIRTLTLGHFRVYEDLIYVWLIQQLFPEHPDHYPGSPELMMEKIRNTIRQQPRIESVYLLSCLTMALKRQNPQACEAISEAGLKALPGSWRLPIVQAYVDGFLLDQPLKAAFWYHRASVHPDAPAFAKSLAAKMLNRAQPAAEELKNQLNYLESLNGWNIFRQFERAFSDKRLQ